MNISLLKLYHFVAKEKMYNRIHNFSLKLKQNFSKTMRLIIDTMMPILDYYIIFEHESSEFAYNQFQAEVNISFYIDPNVYRKLKNTHGTMHTYSIAVLLRKMIDIFFILLDAKDLDWIMNAMRNGIKKIINILNKNKKLFKNQKNILHMFEKDQIEEQISLIFSKNYALLGVEYIKKRKRLPNLNINV